MGNQDIRWTFSDGNNAASQGLGAELSTTGTTQVTIKAPPVDTTSRVKRLTPTTSVAPLSSLALSQATAATVVQFQITDNDPDGDGIPNGGTSDNQPTLVNQITLKLRGPSPVAYALSGSDLSTPVLGVPTTDGSIRFNLTDAPLSIANNSSKIYSLQAWFTRSSVVDSEVLSTLSFDQNTFKLDSSGSQFQGNYLSDVKIQGEVIASALKTVTPGSFVSGQPSTLTVLAVDANGNVDVDATGEVTLQLASGAGSLQKPGVSGAPTATLARGVATFSGIIYRAATDGELFTLRALGSGNAAILTSAQSSAITADVVATKLEIQGTPSTTTLQSGQAVTLSGLSVAAVDASGMLDTQWLSGTGSQSGLSLMLSLRGASDQTLVGTANALSRGGGDVDASPLTITLDRTAVGNDGRIDLGGLQLSYTNSQGSASDQLVLKAERLGGASLAAAFSPLLTSVSNLTPNTAPSLSLATSMPAFLEAGGSNNTLSGSGPVAIAPNASLSDAEQTSLQSLKVVLINPQPGDQLALANPPTGLSASLAVNGSELTITGTAPLSSWQTALQAITFNNNSDAPNTNTRQLTITANDGQVANGSTTADLSLSVLASNDLPRLTGLSALSLTTAEDQALALNLTSLAFADADSGTPISLTLTPTGSASTAAGSLAAKPGAGVTVSNTPQGGLLLQGTAEKIQAWLGSSVNGLTYTPTANANGTVTLGFSADDGSGPRSLGSTVIQITPVNDPAIFSNLPSSIKPLPLAVGRPSSLQTVLGSTTPISLADVDLGEYGTITTLTLTASNATLGGVAGGLQSAGATLTLVNASTWQVTGTPVQINSLLANPAITLQATAGGNVSLQLLLNDGSGVAGATTTATIQLQGVTDPLLINSASSSGTARAMATNQESSLSFLTITDPDASLTSASSFLAASTYTLTVGDPGSSAQLLGLKDADLSSPGLQLQGTAAQINAALAAGRFQALADGAASLSLSLSSVFLAQPISSTAYFNASNTAPTLSTVTPLTGPTEDVVFPIGFDALLQASDAADAGGAINGFEVTAVDLGKGSLKIAGSPWDATNNNRITADRPAQWTPISDLNGSPVAAAFQVKAIDNGGLSSPTAKPVAIVVTPVNDLPTITGVPGSSSAISTGVAAALADFTVADVDSPTLSVSLVPSNGTIGGLNDLDTSRDGIQLRDTPANVNIALAAATFTPTTAGEASIAITVNDGDAASTKGTYNLLASSTNSVPSLSSLNAARTVSTGLADALSYITVADADPGQILSLSLTITGTGSISGLSDADPSPGIQISGSVSQLNAALAAASYRTNSTGNVSINATLSDGIITTSVTGSYSLTVSNPAPTLTSVNTLTGGQEDQPLPITLQALSDAANEADSNGSVTAFEVTSVDASKGSLSIGGSAWNANNNKLITVDLQAVWTPAANSNGNPVAAAFEVKAIDDGGAASSSPVAVAITVAPVNDAPVLSSGTYTYTSVNEDTATAGATVTALLASRATDVDTGTTIGIAISGATGRGTWQYSTDNGSTWSGISNVASSAALLLTASTQVRYQPDGQQGEAAPTLTFSAWDGSEGTAGSKVDITSGGGSSAFSSATNTATVTVTAVDDPLTLSLSRTTTTSNNITAAAITYQELDNDGTAGNDLMLLDSGLTLSDPDSTQTRSAVKLLINSGLVAAEDRLELQGAGNASTNNSITTTTRSFTVGGSTATVTAAYNQTTGVLDLSTTGAQNQAFWQEVLRAVGYRNISDNPTTSLNSNPRVLQVEMLADNMFVRRDSAGLPHFYEYIAFAQNNYLTWTASKAAAASWSYAGMAGYLATITSADENAFIADRLSSNGWIGASDAVSEGATEGNWKWVTSPSGESILQFSSSNNTSSTANPYVNWHQGEPNGGGNENYAQISSINGAWKWNDLPDNPNWNNPNTPRGYIVEYSSSSVTDITFSKTFNISLQAGNDAPLLASASPTLTQINEDLTSGHGQLISTVIAANTITDPDTGASLGGIAITSLNSGNGRWEYRLNNAGTWQAMGNLSDNASLLLRPSDAVRFVPDGENGTSASFAYRAWDQTSGSAGDPVNTSQRGGSTAFSTASNTASISVTPVNDAPVWNNNATIKLPSAVRSEPSNSLKISALIADSIDDVDLNASTGVAITGITKTNGNGVVLADNGKWQYRTSANGSWSDLIAASDGNARLLDAASELRYLPDATTVGPVISGLTLRAWDTTSGTSGSTANITSTGTTSAFSTATRSATIAVNGVTLAGNLGAITATENVDQAVGTGLLLSGNGTLNFARVQIAKGLAEGDQLFLPSNSSGISGQWDASSGTLTLSGTASVAAYEAALQNVQFRTGDDPTALSSSRTIGWFLEPDSTSANYNTSAAFRSLVVTAVADAPTITTGALGSYTESGAAISIAPNLTLTDPDDGQIASATVSISSNRQSGDTLSISSSLVASDLGITSSFTPNTGVLSLSGIAKRSSYQEVLRAVQFSSTNGELTANGAAPNRGISWSVEDANSDGLGATTGVGTGTLAIQAINSAPLLTLGSPSNSIAYTEGGSALVLDAGISLSDADDTALTRASVQLSPVTPGDLLALGNGAPSTISAQYNSNQGVLLLTPVNGTTAPLVDFQAALRCVTYSSSSDDPTANSTSRSISWSITDANSDGASGGTLGYNINAGTTITLTATADPPVLAGAPSTTPSYSEGDAAVTLAPGLVLSDADDTQISKAEIKISAGLLSGDQLSFTDANGITGRYDSSTGTLTLKGTASLADYQAALHSISYRSTATDLPSSGNRSISWRVLEVNSDGLVPQWSATLSSSLTVTGVNQAPVLSGLPNGTSPIYLENGSAVILAPDLLVSDADSSQLSGATVTLGDGISSGDSLALAQAVSGITATYNSNTGVLSLSGTASRGSYQEALRQVVFSSSSDNPTASSRYSRRISWQITDSTNPMSQAVTSQAVTSTIQVTAANDIPTLSAFGGVVKSGGEDSTIEISYSDLIGSGNNQAQVADVDGTVSSLQVQQVHSGSLKLGSSAANASPYAPGSNDTINANTNAYWTPAANVNGTGLNAFSVVARDDQGGLSLSPRPVRVDVTGDGSDAAQIVNVLLPANATYIPGQNLDITVVYDRAVTVTLGSNTAAPSPSLPITLNTGGTINAVYVPGSGSPSTTLLFRAGVASGQNDPDGISIGSAISLPAGASITSLDDGSGVPAPLTLPALPSLAAVRVDGINDAPSLGTNEASISYGENDPAKAVNPAISLSDSDSSQLSGATVSISAGYTAGDLLSLPAAYLASGGSNGITAVVSSTANGPVVTLSGVASLGAYQDALRAITYRSSSDHPTASSNSRTISWQLTDYDATASLQASSAPFSTTINLSPRNDRPTFSALTPGAFSTSEDSSLMISLAALLGAGDEADVDGSVTGFVVKEVSSGSLRLGATATSAAAWAAGSNDTISSGVNAYWTPPADVNTTGSNPLEAFTLLALDNGDAVSSTPVALQVAISADQADTARLSRFSLPANGTYAIGETLRFELLFDRDVTISSNAAERPSLVLQLAGGRTGVAVLEASQSGTVAAGSPLTFAYTVQAGDSTGGGGLGLPASLTLPNASSLSSVDDGASLSVPAALPAADGSGLALDGLSPVLASISGVAGNQAASSSQILRLQFSEPVKGLELSHLSLIASGSASGQLESLQAVNASNGSAQEVDVQVTGISGSGRLRLELNSGVSGLRDQAGNPLSGSSTGGELVVDRDAPPAPRIDPISTEDLLSQAEASDPAGLTISGQAKEVEAGQLLGLAVSASNSNTAVLNLSTPVGSDGRWSLTLTPSQLTGLADGTYTATTSLSDAAGNGAPAASRSLRIDRLAPSLSNPRLEGSASTALADGMLNAAETSSELRLSGSSDAENGQAVELILSGNGSSLSRSAPVNDGRWELQLLPQDLEALSDGELSLQLLVSDGAGNSTSLSQSIQLDRSAPLLNLLPVGGDSWINLLESNQPLVLQGISEGLEEGQSITLTMPARAQTPTVPYSSSISSDAFSLTIPAEELRWADGSTIEISVSTADRAGNPLQLSRSVRVDLTPPTIALQLLGLAGGPVDLAAFSGVINAEQIAAGLQLSSAASSDAAVTVVDAGESTGLLVAPQEQADGSRRWSMAIDPLRMGLPLEGTVPIQVRSVDEAGNSISANATLTIDRAAALSLTTPLDGEGGNNLLNATEAAEVVLSGETEWVEPGTVINLTVRKAAGTAGSVASGEAPVFSATTTTGSDGRWSTSANWSSLADGDYNLELQLSDRAGNRAEVSQAFAINTAPPVFVLTAVAGDNLLNAAELGAAVAPSVGGLVRNAEDGQRVVVTFPAVAASDTTAAIPARSLSAEINGGVWTLPLPEDLRAAFASANGRSTFGLALTNAAGNSASSEVSVTADSVAPVLSLDALDLAAWSAAALAATSSSGSGSGLSLSGSVEGLEAGQPLLLSLNGRTYSPSRSETDPNRWSLSLPAAAAASLRASGNSLRLRASDLAGNGASLEQSFDLQGLEVTPPLIQLPSNRTFSLNEGQLLIGQLKADRPVSWSLLLADPALAINESSGSLAFRRAPSLADTDGEGQPLADLSLGDLTLEATVVATDSRNNRSIEQVTVVVRNLADPKADLLDQDGIAAELEDAATTGRPDLAPGDLNNDGIADRLQPNVAAVPWISSENFQAALADPSQAAPNSFAALQSSADVRIASVAVRKAEELAVAGNGSSALPAQLSTTTLNAGATAVTASLVTPYDPLLFKLESYDPISQQALDHFVDLAPPLADGSDPYPGNQVRQTIDLPGDGLLINTYLKWNPTAAKGAGAWYEFLADGDPNTYDNGAELIDLNGDGRIDRIVLTYTDGDPAAGDIDGLVNGIIDDPGVPALLQSADGDGDGSSDASEANLDGNGDGIPDASQAQVVSFPAAIGAGQQPPTLAALLIDDHNTGSAASGWRSRTVLRQSKAEATPQASVSALQAAITAAPANVVLPSSLSRAVLAVSEQLGSELQLELTPLGSSPDEALASTLRQHFSRTIQQLDVLVAEEQPWNGIAQRQADGSLQLLGYNPATGLGAVLLDRDGNGKVDGARLFLADATPSDGTALISANAALVALEASPRLLKSSDGLGLKVEGLAGTGLWLQLAVSRAEASWQNSLELVTGSGQKLGSIGAAPGATQQELAHNRTEIYLAAGEELRFLPGSGNRASNSGAVLRLQEGDSAATTYRLQLEDGGAAVADFNDLEVAITSRLTPAHAAALPLARAQRSSSDALLDLSTLPASASSSGSIKLNLTIDSDAAYRNRLGFVAVEVEELDGVTHYRVGGVAMGNSGAFRDAVLKSSQWVSDSVTGQQNFGGGQASNRFSWDLSLPDRQSNPTASRLFAPVLLNPNGEFYTFGASASDGQQHVKLQGTNTFSFEDLLASQRSDWDFNDIRVKVDVPLA